MMMMSRTRNILSSLILILCITACTAAHGNGVKSEDRVRYDGHAVFRFPDISLEQLQIIEEMYIDAAVYQDRWSHNAFRVPPSMRNQMEQRLQREGIAYDVMIDNVQSAIDREQYELHHTRSRGDDDSMAFFQKYHTIDEINKYIHSLAAQYPHLMRIVTIGQTFENRTIYGVEMTAPSSMAPRDTTTGRTLFDEAAFTSRPGIFYEGNIHAREWITSATMTYLLHAFTSGYASGQKNVTTLLQNIAYTIVPVVNVDGFVYSHTTNRMWRKTRTQYPGDTCRGADPNRNWDDHWCVVGASPDPCSDEWCGPKAFSEPCVRSVANYVKKLQNQRGFIDFHSFSQLWMQPYGYTQKLPKDHKAQRTLGHRITAAIKSVHGMKYEDGDIIKIIYPASGSSADWTYDVAGIKYSYGVELRDTGEYGFLLPASEIIPQGEEIWAGVQVMGSEIIREAQQQQQQL